MANDAPDPSVIRGDDGAFYAYTTQAYHDVEFVTLPILRSTDLVTWELVGDAFAGDARPPWIVPGNGNGDVWAPHIARVGGKYLLYYSASSASTLSFGIGVAVADSPDRPFPRPRASRSSPARDSRRSTRSCSTTTATCTSTGARRAIRSGSSRSRPTACRSPASEPRRWSRPAGRTSPSSRARGSSSATASTTCMYSGDSCCGANPSYAVLDARATSPLGPFERDPGNPVLAANERFNAPGHNAVVTDDAGTDWMVYHAMDREEGSGLRFLMLDPIDWSTGWPVVNGGTRPVHQLVGRRP